MSVFLQEHQGPTFLCWLQYTVDGPFVDTDFRQARVVSVKVKVARSERHSELSPKELRLSATDLPKFCLSSLYHLDSLIEKEFTFDGLLD